MPSGAKTVACRVYSWSALKLTTFVQAKCLQAVQGGPKTYSGGHWLGRQRNRHWEGQHCHQLWHARDRREAWQWCRHILAQSAYPLFSPVCWMVLRDCHSQNGTVRMCWSSISCYTPGSPDEPFACTQGCYSSVFLKVVKVRERIVGLSNMVMQGGLHILICTFRRFCLLCCRLWLCRQAGRILDVIVEISWVFKLKWQYDHRS